MTIANKIASSNALVSLRPTAAAAGAEHSDDDATLGFCSVLCGLDAAATASEATDPANANSGDEPRLAANPVAGFSSVDMQLWVAQCLGTALVGAASTNIVSDAAAATAATSASTPAPALPQVLGGDAQKSEALAPGLSASMPGAASFTAAADDGLARSAPHTHTPALAATPAVKPGLVPEAAAAPARVLFRPDTHTEPVADNFSAATNASLRNYTPTIAGTAVVRGELDVISASAPTQALPQVLGGDAQKSEALALGLSASIPGAASFTAAADDGLARSAPHTHTPVLAATPAVKPGLVPEAAAAASDAPTSERTDARLNPDTPPTALVLTSGGDAKGDPQARDAQGPYRVRRVTAHADATIENFNTSRFAPLGTYPAGVVDATNNAVASFAAEVSQHVNYWISQDVQNAELQVDGLGATPVQVHISLSGNEAQVVFRSDHAQTRELLSHAMAQLDQLLRAQGLALSGASVDDTGNPHQGDAPPEPRAGRTARVAGPSGVPVPSLLVGTPRPSAVGALDCYV